MTATLSTAQGGALTILGPDQTDLLRDLDRTLTGWAAEAGAREIMPPPVYPLRDLEKFDVYANFPHLQFVGGPLDVTGAPPAPVGGAFSSRDVDPPFLGLPHSSCYGAYLYFEGQSVAPDTTITLINRCFRNEQKYEGLRRLLSFQMREIVAIGTYEHTQDVIARFTDRIEHFAKELGLELHKEAASDPFFERDGGRALLTRLSPVKHEFQADGLAIASVNTHRNFFGERCAITVGGTGEHAFTGCVAFGLERWLAVLGDRFGGDLQEARAAVNAAAA
ncbi:class-II aminoacyl-tRNA synthetase family protein [Streptomyces nondiastaticus]|uniref:Aminoacyl-transfer RNA synthetases class-II family profile domain-containing protein n=1 Tax=Streptomyces nondiastaticus TaxID=3154512 RepID=A0ABW6TSL0_9ACTN